MEMRERSAKTRENKVLNHLSCYRNLFTAAHSWFTFVFVHLCSPPLFTAAHRLWVTCCSGGSEHGVPLPRERRERKREGFHRELQLPSPSPRGRR
uniref:Uncharacterized protein n=1 Tax=Nelumbo nucifera TaxID=4432 RepID=A0A822ZSP3_NELNU|nr:TPA_asm: hypothetical protein HUJ06_004176 [Nelumbo nucifera]